MVAKEDKSIAKEAAAAAQLCALSDIYTRTNLEGKWRELIKVYDQRKNDDNLKEILDLSAPSARLTDLNGWHLERMAVGELDPEKGASARDLAIIHGEAQRTKRVLEKLFASAESFQARRDELVNAMVKQRDALLTELDAAKEFLAQIHRASEPTAIAATSGPVPVDQRLLSTITPPEAAPSVDLSEAPSI